ncbi:NAD(P)(+) transhydrogenase (Re/Si-specific) subunit beta [Porphyromonas pogonae]|uniref:NAD(P)(+) transhydrogenase (Re/Si-specific) subunit beta n=1 Tax=Porphyromonas pogonae TaxID=867595 RepID=UPI002E789098|nr:NAD(P)(+) transhydrogenase (Re/Si-specific) subunit beta [Porphyromonas pogonae]
MSTTLYYIICSFLAILVLLGISMMSRVKTAILGNKLSAFAMLGGVLVTLAYNNIFPIYWIYLFMLIGALIGGFIAAKVKMIQMPQLVALLNGIGGGASALVGILSIEGIGLNPLTENAYPVFTKCTAMLAIVVGTVTLVGSLVAGGKLHKLIPQKPVIWPNHSLWTNMFLLIAVVFIVLGTINIIPGYAVLMIVLGSVAFSAMFGLFFSIRVGGADMPITISLLNSLSGLAGAIAGLAINDILLVAVGGIVGASGLLLTQIMCRAMNRSLASILMGGAAAQSMKNDRSKAPEVKPMAESQMLVKDEEVQPVAKQKSCGEILRSAKNVIIVPGYGMALAQAQHQVRQLADKLSENGADVKYAIHPVAGRMPGHMNVLLCEADVPYEQLYEMDAINDDFAKADIVIVIGANDVLNPAARDAEGTPIYGMPVLNVDQAPEIIICNFDLKPGYAGVENPLYSKEEGVHLLLGDAKESLTKLLHEFDDVHTPDAKTSGESDNAIGTKAEHNTSEVLKSARKVIIVPGYGMALAQAQHQVRMLADQFMTNGAEVKYAIHPVAGRMPGHMNVLLCEADVPYEQLYEMDSINNEFASADVVVVIGANDVLNPAARDAEGTPIYGMPVLNVDQAPNIFICNFDLKPGYAGVENPLYTRAQGVYLYLGDAKDSLAKLLSSIK